MFNCKKTTELISKNQEAELSFWERVSTRMHVFMCKYCKAFEKDIKAIGQFFETQKTISLKDSEKEMLLKTVKEKLGP